MAVPVFTTAVDKVKAVAAVAETQPTQGVLTYAGTVSTEVEIARPRVEVGIDRAVTAFCAARVKPVHVTVTAPMAVVAPAASVILMTFEAYVVVDTAEGAGELTSQAVAPEMAVTKPGGNERVITPLLGITVEVVN